MRTLKLIVALLLVMCPALAQAQQPVPFAGQRLAPVMTQNLYVGADLDPVVFALAFGTPSDVVSAVTTTFAHVQQTDFPARATALAKEIAAKQPTLIGLQEVVRFITHPFASPVPVTVIDYLDILLAALAAQGLHYAPVAIMTGTDAQAAGFINGVFHAIRLTDRDVILARTDLSVDNLQLSNVQASNFQTNLSAGPLTLKRGWTAVDVKIRGKAFRLVNTHLEPLHPGVQAAQVQELLDGPGDTALPVVFVGDFNSAADGSTTATYANLIAVGFVDAWSQANLGDPGLTCCHLELLNNPDSSVFTRRIDLVLFRGGFGVVGAERVGEEPADKTSSGLWPSDHAGVAATLVLPQP